MEKVLPKGWVETELGSVSEIVTGNTPSKSVTEYYGDDILWVKPGDFHGQKIIFKTEEKLSELGFQKSRKVPAGSILVTCIGNLGNISMASEDLATNQQINSIVIPHDKLSRKYIYYYSLTLKKWLIDNSTSTTISMVNKSVFEKAPVVFPPLAEQERIVTKLDKLFAQHEKIKAALDRIPQLLKDFRQQVLTQAVTGKLTEEWREGKDLEEWTTPMLKDVCFGFKYGSSSKSDDEGNVAVLRMGNLQNGKLDLSDLKYSNNMAEIQKYFLESGDVLFNRTNSPELVGKTSIYKGEIPAIYAGYLIKIENDRTILDSDYLNFYMNTPQVRTWCNEVKSDGVSQSNINAKKLADLEIPLPTLREQQEIVRRVESLFAKADAIEAHYQALKEKIDSLPQAFLHKAFKGELVPQLPTDGDAKDLLAEIIALKNESKKRK
ncbi:restriction endonuclease subunit S [Sphingobacterium sp. SRCM116780]|uniref:restriction endonuclease subunit S n=1 Tax=Sphingobacterium sp. SRCM116780 TaxID=2907623 RepID=UPI001F1B9459|nr:restriction endonuclease subunit S [Sphingobacterium sp. SRCM116780]UIR56707.1 restriction endonuclease subunit S [Sphingobacterium sp. SRCM116780]